MAKKQEKVRDGYLGDLPENIQTRIMEVHKIIKNQLDELMDLPVYADLEKSSWAMSCIDEFKAMPKDKTNIGSFRVYREGKKKYKTMIQITGHFTNHRYGWIEELLHDFIANVFAATRPVVRKKFDNAMVNEGAGGESHEGFDLYLTNKESMALWNAMGDRKTKSIKEGTEFDDDDEEYEEDAEDDFDDIEEFDEKKSEEQYRLDAFKKRFNYKDGYIVYNGRRIKCDININDPYIRLKDGTPVETKKTCATPYDLRENKDGNVEVAEWQIVFARNAFRIKNGKEIDATLSHEVGHLVNHADQKAAQGITALDKQEREAVRKYAQKYVDKGSERLNVDELEADRFAANRTSERAMIKSLRRSAKADNKISLDTMARDTLTDIMLDRGDMHPSKIKKITQQMLHPDERSQYGKAAKAIYQKYLNDDRYPSKMSFDNFQKYFDIDIAVGTYQPQVDIDKADLTRRGAIRMSNNIANRSRAGRQEMSNADLAARKQALKDPVLRGAKYLKDDKTETVDVMMAEATQITPEYKEAKKTLRTIGQRLMNDLSASKGAKMSQYNANLIANIITRDLLPVWAGSYRKLTITLTEYSVSCNIEFKVPKMTQDFVARFINGRESINGFLHRQPEIKIKISPRVFHSIKEPDDIYNFFKSAVMYYDSKVDKAAQRLMIEAMKLNHSMKQLIGSSALCGVVTCPLSLLFIFDGVQLNRKNCFDLDKSDVDAVSRFIKNIPSKYAAPEKEKKKIVDDVREVVKALRESADDNETAASLRFFPEEVEALYFSNKYAQQLQDADDRWIHEQVDYQAMRDTPDPQAKYMCEMFGVKKLKKIPRDLIAYIQIETESIKDANDKMMISSYCLSKLEIVEWYIELIDVGSKKYIVPHPRPYLEAIRTQLLACHKKIMETPIPKADRPLISVQYPAGYEG